MKVKGIKRGTTIELSNAINIADGTEILIEIEDPQLLSFEERRARLQSSLNQSLGSQEDFLEVLKEVELQRKIPPELAYLNIELLANFSSESLTSIIGTGQGSFTTPEDADRFIRQERDEWDS